MNLKPREERLVSISIQVNPLDIEVLERLAIRNGISRAFVIRKILEYTFKNEEKDIERKILENEEE
jgi:hypothetical protein